MDICLKFTHPTRTQKWSRSWKSSWSAFFANVNADFGDLQLLPSCLYQHCMSNLLSAVLDARRTGMLSEKEIMQVIMDICEQDKKKSIVK